MENKPMKFNYKGDTNKDYSGELTMEINREILTDLINLFDIEIEAMKGEIKQLKNGQLKITVNVESTKGEVILAFMRQLMFNNYNQSNN